MRRLLTVISFLVLTTVTAFGQFWNRPNAQYTFHWTAYAGGNYLGFKQLSIDNDTLIEGNLYSRYRDYSVSYLGGSNPFDSAYFDTTSVLTNIAFYEEDSVLYAHHLSQNNSQIDTLYDFGALPGESWTIPQYYQSYESAFSYGCDSLILVNVLDTGHVNYQGQALYYLKVSYSGSSAIQMQETDTIFERFGSKQISFLSVHNFCTINAPFNDGGSPYNLTCYNDDQISLGEDCAVLNVYTGLTEIEQPTLSFYPNPATDNVTIAHSGPQRLVDIHVFDVVGRTVHTETRLSENRMLLNLAHLPSGQYVISLFDGEVRQTQKLMVTD